MQKILRTFGIIFIGVGILCCISMIPFSNQVSSLLLGDASFLFCTIVIVLTAISFSFPVLVLFALAEILDLLSAKQDYVDKNKYTTHQSNVNNTSLSISDTPNAIDMGYRLTRADILTRIKDSGFVSTKKVKVGQYLFAIDERKNEIAIITPNVNEYIHCNLDEFIGFKRLNESIKNQIDIKIATKNNNITISLRNKECDSYAEIESFFNAIKVPDEL